MYKDHIKGRLQSTTLAVFLIATSSWMSVGLLSLVGLELSSARAEAATLTAAQIAAIQSSVQTALANVNPSLTGTAKEQAIASALAQATKSAIGTYGADALSIVAAAANSSGLSIAQIIAAIMPAAVDSGIPVPTVSADLALGAITTCSTASSVAEAIIAAGIQNNYSDINIGTGLGQAATELYKGNSCAAYAIANAVANDGTSAVERGYAQGVIDNGGPINLASAGIENPTVFGEGPNGNGHFQRGGTGDIIISFATDS